MKRIIFYMYVLIAVSLAGSRFRCDYSYNKAADGFLKYQEIPANWYEARLRCHLEGSTLASPLTPGITAAMINLTAVQDGVRRKIFTGIQSTFSRGDYLSVEGVPLSNIRHNWARGEPNNKGNRENCIAMLPDGSLADARCEVPLPYLCFKKDSKTLIMNQCGTIDNEYVPDARTGQCYKFHRNGRTWSRAYMACAAEGGHLAVINSDVEAKVLHELFAKNPASLVAPPLTKNVAFIGFHDWGEHGDFWTIDGQSLKEAGFDKFSPGEPNNMTNNGPYVGQFCGAFFRTNGMLNDMFCEKPGVFFCEKSPDSLRCDDDE